MEAHKGSIGVKSELGTGTEFLIELPIITSPIEKDEFKGNSLDSNSNVINKIEIEFSDIYSINFDNK